MALGHDRFFDPGALRFALTLAGVVPPDIRKGCEIGRDGLSAAIAAAAHPGTEWHAAFDDTLAAGQVGAIASQAGLALEVSEGIEAFAARDDLPMFDFIGLTESWSLLGEGAQEAVLALAERRLKPGGVFYARYLVQPGAALDTPLRLLGRTLLRGASPADPDFEARFAAMLDEAETALAAAPMLQTRHTGYLSLIAELRDSPDAEAVWWRWFAPAPDPTTFLDLAGRFGEAGLTFAASADLTSHAPEINFTPRQRAYLGGIGDAATREQMADLISYTWGRADYWVKGAVRLGADARAKALGEARLALVRPTAAFDYRVRGMLGAVSLRREAYGPLLARLEQGPARLGDLPGERDAVLEAAALLIGADAARALPGTEADDGGACRRLNSALFAAAAEGRPIRACAAPLLRGGLEMAPRSVHLFAALAGGARDADALARRCAEMEGISEASSQAARIARDARAFLDGVENLRRLGVV